MPDKPTFGRYAEIPYEQMTLEQQEAYRSLIETRAATPLRETLRIFGWLAASRVVGQGKQSWPSSAETTRLRILDS